MKILIIDNFDSFTYNLYQYVGELLYESDYSGDIEGAVKVFRNNEITLSEIYEQKFDRIILSPGPGSPDDRSYFGVCADVLTEVKDIKILGVCLGMQGMAHYFGGKVLRAASPMHGKTSKISHDAKGLFKNLPQEIDVMRYHSLVAEKSSLPECLEITAQSNDTANEIMGLRHKTLPIEGIQFHPESFATEGGKIMLGNFLFN